MRPTATTSDAHRSAGIALCLVSAVGFGLMAIFAKEGYAAGLGVTAMLAARFVLAAVLFWAIVAVRARLRDDVPRIGRRAVLACLGLGGIGYAAQAGLFFSALEHIDASLASLLLYTYPALVFCGAVALRREHVTRAKAAALVLASAGTALVLLGGGTHGLEATGVALALGAGASYATYILVAETVIRRLDPLLLSALIATGAAATFLVVGAARDVLQFTAEGWLWIAALATFSTVLAIVTFMMGMKRVGASTASIVSTFEPVVTVGLAIALYGETLGALQVLGGMLVLAAVVALQLRAAQVAAPAAASATLPA